jgi:hypothetical protein
VSDFNFDVNSDNANTWLEINRKAVHKQLINKFTRITDTSATTIDNTLVNKLNNVSESGVKEIPLSDHFFTFIGRKFNYKKNLLSCQSNSIEYRDWTRLDFDKLLKDLSSADFSTLCSTETYNSNNFCDKLTNILTDIFNNNFPLKLKLVRSCDSQTWLNVHIKSLIRECDIKYKQYMRTVESGSDFETLKDEYKHLRNKVVSSVRRAQKYYFDLINKNYSNNKKLWSNLSKIIPTKKSMKNFKSVIDNDLDLDTINEYFVSHAKKIIIEGYGEYGQNNNNLELLGNIPQTN